MNNGEHAASLRQMTAQDLREIEVTDEETFLEWLPLAARLAALGDDSFLRKWPEHRKSLNLNMDSLLRRRADEGIWDIDHAEETQLALALVSAQDFYFFLLKEGEILSPASRAALNGWAEVASDTYGDIVCVEFLTAWRERLGEVPDDWLLAPVAAPVTEFEAALVQPQIKLPEYETLFWTSAGKITALRELVQLDTDEPGEKLLESYDYEVQLPGVKDGEAVTLRATLTSEWITRFEFDDESIVPDSMSFGILKAELGRPGSYFVDLKSVPAASRRAALFSRLVIRIAGRSFLVTFDDE